MDERLECLRAVMAERKIDAYLVPSGDYHLSEFTEEYFKCKEFLTGFHGASGTVVITMSDACLWTGKEYWDEAEEKLRGTGCRLKRMGEPGVPTIAEYLREAMPDKSVLGFDGRVVSCRMGKWLEEELEKKQIRFSSEEDLVGLIWEDRPKLSMEPVWLLPERYAGRTAKQKIDWLRAEMKKAGAEAHILTALEDISWLFNLRANDTPCNPVVRAYSLVTMEEVFLFLEEDTLEDAARTYLADSGVAVRPYYAIYKMAASLSDNSVLLESGKVSYAIMQSLGKGVRVIDRKNPTTLAKAIKNPVEVESERQAHIKDGTAVTKFIYWLKKNVGKLSITEISAARHLDELRAAQEGYLGISFRTISAYRDHAAHPHYFASPDTDRVLEPEGLYMVDSGGQYYEGTTDITRTVALGELTEEERKYFTLVVICMLRLAGAKFPYGCRGTTLDYAAREPLWSRGLNYDHGTGHGVGFLLNVHEGPNGIRYRFSGDQIENPVLEEGMICSDEPGLYLEGQYGMRTENMIVCRKGEKTPFGQFMEFEPLTMAPIDLDVLDISLMEQRDIDSLNAYHQLVYNKIAPHLTEEEAIWLKEATKPIEK